jgi:hypothetical protein
MEWLATGGCPEAHKFGWLVGNASGLYAMAIIFVLIASAPAYRADVPLAVNATLRWAVQWLLFFAQPLLLAAWVGGAYHVGAAMWACYVPMVGLGALFVIAPLMLLLMFTAANWVGRASAR